ncbi:MAG: preprotein translocase subunit SecE [Pseudomonadota bacterium]
MAMAEGKETKPARKSAAAKPGADNIPAKPARAAKEKDAQPSGPAVWLGQAVQFLREVKTELKKVTWPGRKQAMSSTGVVLVLVILSSVFLALVDYALSNIVRALIRMG